MAAKEKQKLARGLLLLTLTGFHAGFYLLCDYGLYWILDIIRKHFRMRVSHASKKSKEHINALCCLFIYQLYVVVEFTFDLI